MPVHVYIETITLQRSAPRLETSPRGDGMLWSQLALDLRVYSEQANILAWAPDTRKNDFVPPTVCKDTTDIFMTCDFRRLRVRCQ